MGNATVTSITVISPHIPVADEMEDGIEYISEGDLSEPQLVDKIIEDPAHRSFLAENEGLISVTVLPGESLGQVSINVQFEGKSGLYNLCLERQGELVEKASDWLAELLSEFDVDFDVRIEAKPCPKASKRLPLKRAAEILGTVEVRNALVHVGPSVVVKNEGAI